jgi:hypothetical protein
LMSMHLRRKTPSENNSGSRVSTPGSPLGVFVNLRTLISGQPHTQPGIVGITYMPSGLPLSALVSPSCLPKGSSNLHIVNPRPRPELWKVLTYKGSGRKRR